MQKKTIQNKNMVKLSFLSLAKSEDWEKSSRLYLMGRVRLPVVHKQKVSIKKV